MSDRLRRETLRELQDLLDRVIGCVAIAPVQRVRPDRPDAPVVAFETPGESVPLRSPLGLGLRVRLRARVGPVEGDPGRWQARIVAYQYALLDGDGREYVAYHWHPDGSSHVTEPHLHLGPAAHVGVGELAAAHLPTGPVSLASVVRVAVDGLGGRPLRADWTAVLMQATRPLTPSLD